MCRNGTPVTIMEKSTQMANLMVIKMVVAMSDMSVMATK